MESGNVIPITQFGFRKNKNTSHAVELLVQEVKKLQLAKKKCMAIFIDVSKAFDCCKHDIILDKLKHIGADENTVSLFKSYLSNRTQTVQIGDFRSEKIDIKIGVGQGTILGPTLFKLYTHDFNSSISGLAIQFADDTSVIIHADTEEELEILANSELCRIKKWLDANGLTLNGSKTRIMCFGNFDVNVEINGEIVEACGRNNPEKSFNMLGIEIDNKFTWKNHMEKVINKLGKGRYILYRYRKSLNNKARKLIFNSFISSHIRYGIKVWGGIRGRTRHKLNMSFKKAVRSLDIGKIHTEPILKKYKLLTIDQIYKNDLNLIAWEYFNGGIPEAIKNNILHRNVERQLRNDTHTLVPASKTANDPFQYHIKLCKKINNLREDWKLITSRSKIKTVMKRCAISIHRDIVTCNSPRCIECMNY